MPKTATKDPREWVDEAIALLERCRELLLSYYGTGDGSSTVMEISELLEHGLCLAIEVEELLEDTDDEEEDIFQ